MPHEPIAEACHCCFLIRYLVCVQLAHHLPSSQEMGWQRPEFTLEVTRQLRVHSLHEIMWAFPTNIG